MPSFRQRLADVLRNAGVAADTAALERLERHRDLLLEWNGTAHLVSAADAESAADSPASATGGAFLRHHAEAAAVIPFLPPAAEGLFVDIGTGGGFPGLVWGSLQPNRSGILVEGARRKCAFLRDAVRALELESFHVETSRLRSVEEIASLAPRVVTSRAAGLSALIIETLQAETTPLTAVLFLGADDLPLLDPLPPGVRIDARLPRAAGRPGAIAILSRHGGVESVVGRHAAPLR